MPGANSYDELIKSNRVVNAAGTSVEDVKLRIFSRDNIITVNIIIGAVAFFIIVILGIRLIFSFGKEDTFNKSAQEIGWVLLGLFLVSAATYLGLQVFDPTDPDVLSPESQAIASLASKLHEIKIWFEVAVAGFALIMLVWTGYSIIIGGENDDTVQQEKNFIGAFILSVVLILMAETLVFVLSGGYFSQTPGAIQQAGERGILELVGFINYVLMFLGAAILAMFILSAIYYVISFGDEDRTGRATKILINCSIAAVVVLISYSVTVFLI